MTMLVDFDINSKFCEEYILVHLGNIQRLVRLGLSPDIIGKITQNKRDIEFAEHFVELMRLEEGMKNV